MDFILAAATEPAFGVVMPVWAYIVLGALAVGAVAGGFVVRSNEKKKKAEKGKK